MGSLIDFFYGLDHKMDVIFFFWRLLVPMLVVNSSSTGVGWGIIGYESETLPSYHKLRNFSYSVMLN